MGSGKSAKAGGGSRDYFGHCAGIVCQGQLDFVWGVMINNELAWPKAKLWDARTHAKGKTVIYDGNVYKSLEKTDGDPPDFPWSLLAVPWSAGSFDEGDYTLHNGHLWLADAPTSDEPPDDPPVAPSGVPHRNAQWSPVVDGWRYVSTPQEWSALTHFWEANSIVVWQGRIYATDAATNEEPPNAPWELWRVNRADSANPLKFTVEDYGDAYLYWGTSDQVLDTEDEGILSALGHPPYRYRAVLMLKDFLFGTMQVNAPDVHLLGGRNPVQTLISGPAAQMDADWQVNPWCVLAELLTHPVFGLGLPAAWFDKVSWQAEADWCHARASLTYISPMYTSLRSVRALVSDLLGYPDAFIFWTTVATLAAGHWPHGEAGPVFTAANTLDMHDLVAPIADSSEGWDGTADSVAVSFQDIQAGFKAHPVAAANLFNRTVTRRLQTQKIERPHIVRADQAAAWAAEMAKLHGEQLARGALTVRQEKAAAIQAGSLFLLTDDQFQTSEVQRATRKVISGPPSGTAKISFETERGVSPQPYSPTPLNPAPEQGPRPAAILNAQIFQIPADLGTAPNQLALLAQRENEFTSGVQLWFQQADATAYQLLGLQPAFAVSGTVDSFTGPQLAIPNVTPGETYDLGVEDIYRIFTVQSYDPADPLNTNQIAVEGADYHYDPEAGTITVLVGGNVTAGYTLFVWPATGLNVEISETALTNDVESISAALTADEVDDNELLLIAFQSDNPTLFEIMSVKGIEAAGAMKLCTIVGGTYGTLRGGGGDDWSQGDRVFLVPRTAIVAFEHLAFPSLRDGSQTAEFLLAPQSAWVQADITDLFDPAENPDGLCTTISYDFTDPYRPSVAWRILQVNGADISDFDTVFEPDDVFDFTWEMQAVGAGLASAQLIARLGGAETIIWAQSIVGGEVVRGTTFSLPTEGAYQIALLVTDLSGRVAEFPLTEVGGSTEVTLKVATPSSTKVANPTMTSEVLPRRRELTLSCATVGAAIEYQIQDLYDPAGGSWTTYTGPFSVLFYKSVYARATKAGMTDSAVVSWHFVAPSRSR
jgi:hypothetical protein